ncbi:TetR/AcrR family transcriptional regulator [Homoserinimonas sp. OAct 916]|uniref:TetR/AcrR family transcriptional regulator n=1 Tax=Homoserinimonas sp. OAct 916 TaxID=2211450 RepID=UPI000DBE53BF|nr:TetR/AcrR family transcriptional regulator [Homoserinimonas sp. OAct 916]
MSLDRLVDNAPQEIQVRTQLVQERSSARLAGLLDAAAEVIDEVGFERVTTAMVAQRAGASIGTVYRYFPDRIAVLQALRERAIQRFHAAVVDEIKRIQPTDWWGAMGCAIDAFIGMHRDERGFRIIKFVDSVNAPDAAGERFEQGFFARSLAEILSSEYQLPEGDELAFRMEVAVEIGDAIISRAFYSDPQGDPSFLAECRAVIYGYLESHYGPSAKTEASG